MTRNIEQKTAYDNKEEAEIRLFIGSRLREERERLGMTQIAFAEMADVSLRAEQDWERGKSAPKADFLAVAAARGVDVLYVVTGKRALPRESTLSIGERELLANYDAADEKGRAVIETAANFAAQAGEQSRK